MALYVPYKSGRDFQAAESQLRKNFSEYYQFARNKEQQQTEPCRNLYRARTLASVNLCGLRKGCNMKSGNTCKLCEVLLRAAKSSIPENELSPNGIMTWPGFKWYEPTWSTGGNPDNEKQYEIEIFRTEVNEIWGCPRGTFVPESSLSYQSIQQVRQWLKKCRCSSGKASLLPTRVLNIKDPEIARLEEPRGLQGHYACLSHCWGQLQANDSFVTSRNSYETYLQKGIKFENLPQLFRDAIKLAQALDIHYLWIDALCIIQGDEEDWRKESAKMADIYRNCYVNLAATSARDSHGKCVSQLLPHFRAHDIGHGLHSRQKIPHIWEKRSKNVESRKSDQCSTEFPLLERGWVYQERLLAPRVLHVTEHEILWECAERTTCQCKDTEKAYSVTERDPKVDHAMSISFGDTDIKKRWRTVVEEFSSLNLTFEKDCLPALAGLAKQFQEEKLDDGYLAGLWRQSLFEDMLWTAFPGPSKRPHVWRAPTWSWASLQGSIRYLTNTPKDLITFPRLVNAHCEPLGPDSTGELSSGFVNIEGQVITIDSESIGPTQSRLSSASSQIEFCDYYPDLKESVQQDMVNRKFFQTTFGLRLARDPYAVPATEFLLIIREVEPGLDTYERLGLAECRNQEVLAILENMYRNMKVKII